MKISKLILVLLILSLCQSNFAQIDWNHPKIELTANDGLPSTYIKDFVEDEFGFIWILTYSGLCRFDGSYLKSFQSLEIPNEGYLSLKYDAHRKTIWITTVINLYAYHLPTDTFRRFPQSQKSGNPILSLEIDSEHHVWVGTRNFLGKVSEEQDTILAVPVQFGEPQKVAPTDNKIIQLLTDPVDKDKIWLATEGGLATFSPSKKVFKKEEQFIENESLSEVTFLFNHPKDNQIYFGGKSKNGGRDYLIFDAKSQEKLNTIHFPISTEPHTISPFQDSLMLFSNAASLQFFNNQKEKITRQHFNNAENPNQFRVDFIDSKGNIWTGSHEGIKMYQTAAPQAASYFYETDFPNWFHISADLIYDEKSNSLFMPVTGGEGLYQFNLGNRNWQLIPRLDENGETKKTNFTGFGRLQNGERLIVSNRVFYTINEQGVLVKTDEFPSEKMSRGKSFIDSKNVLWGVNKQQITKLDLNTKIEENLTEKVHYCTDYLGEMIVFEDSKSNIWITGFCGGFDYYNRAKNTFQSIDFQKDIKGSSVTGIDEFDGRIWAKTDFGEFIILETDVPEKGIIETISLKKRIAKNELNLVNVTSLDEEYINGGVFDSAGKFWFVTKNGLFNYHHEKNRLELFDESVGIIINDPDLNVFVANHLISLPDGNIAYTTRKGVCIFNPITLTNEKAKPQPYIHSMDVNNELIFADSSALFKQNYYFKPRENFIGFEFSAIDFSNPNHLEFQYKLEGVDEVWKSPGNRKYISYTDLKGGDYAFQLKASNEAGIWSDDLAKIHFKIEDFWYNTLWARGLFILILLASAYAIYRSRLQRAIEKEQIKTKYERELAEIKMQALTAQMNPHFIFNSLNSIDYYIIKNDTKKASHYLNRFSRLMRLILKNSQSNYISLKDDLDALKLYLEIEALRFNHQFDFEIKVAENVDTDYLKIPPMLIQPYVENSIWHGLLHKKDDGKITVHFELDEKNEALKCSVIDNGIGRKKSMELKAQNKTQRERKSFGMNITKDKIEALKFLHGIDAKVEIFDLYDIDNQSIGTKVELIIPV